MKKGSAQTSLLKVKLAIRFKPLKCVKKGFQLIVTCVACLLNRIEISLRDVLRIKYRWGGRMGCDISVFVDF